MSPVTVYFNGSILTMEGPTPEYAEAVVVRDGRITFVGDNESGLKMATDAGSKKPILVDLRGRALLPGFIDGWGHFTLFSRNVLSVNLAYFADDPPKTRADIMRKLRAAKPVKTGWIVGTGYAEALLDGGMPDLDELDAAFPETPVALANMSTLTGKLNSAGLRKLGITADTPAQSPGVIVKDPKTGKLTGDLINVPFQKAFAKAVGIQSQEETFATYREAEALLVREGYTTVQSYSLTLTELHDLRAAFDRGVIGLDVITFPFADIAERIFRDDPKGKAAFGTYSHGDRGIKIAGTQVPTDGSPQLRLAYMSKPYADTSGYSSDWRGYAYYPQDRIDKWVRFAYENDLQVYGYSNGDGGIDMQLEALAKAVKATGKTGDQRTLISHATFARSDQLAKFRDLHVIAALWPANVRLYGDEYRKILGDEKAKSVVPIAEAEKLGVITSLHTDYPSGGPSVIDSIANAMDRKTGSGKTLGGPDSIPSRYFVLQGFTSSAAFMHKEEADKGTITVGKLADLVILDRDPLKVPVDELGSLVVLETIKRGRTVYKKTEDSVVGKGRL